MGLTDSLKRLFGGDDEADVPAYECTTCGRQYEADRTVCADCNGRVEEITPA
jgi:uncharacterized OB-fold protein